MSCLEANVDFLAIKSNSTRFEKRDEICPHYKPIYIVIQCMICSECGLCAMSDKFENIFGYNIKIVRNNISKSGLRGIFLEREL